MYAKFTKKYLAVSTKYDNSHVHRHALTLISHIHVYILRLSLTKHTCIVPILLTQTILCFTYTCMHSLLIPLTNTHARTTCILPVLLSPTTLSLAVRAAHTRSLRGKRCSVFAVESFLTQITVPLDACLTTPVPVWTDGAILNGPAYIKCQEIQPATCYMVLYFMMYSQRSCRRTIGAKRSTTKWLVYSTNAGNTIQCARDVHKQWCLRPMISAHTHIIYTYTHTHTRACARTHTFTHQKHTHKQALQVWHLWGNTHSPAMSGLYLPGGHGIWTKREKH